MPNIKNAPKVTYTPPPPMQSSCAAPAAKARSLWNQAMAQARREVDDADRRLRTAEVSPEERIETQGAIDGLRADLGALDAALRELLAELRAD